MSRVSDSLSPQRAQGRPSQSYAVYSPGKLIVKRILIAPRLRDNRLKDAVSRLQPNVERGANVPLWVQRSMESQLRSMAEELIKSEFDRITATRQRLKMDFTVTKDGVRLRSAVKRERERACATESEASAEALLPRQKIQIIVCSRTFSQLNQYIREFRRLGTLAEHVKIGMATGRSHVCINTSARARCQTNEEFNDYCRNTSCDFRDDVGPLAEAATCFPMDVEDLKAVGTGLCSCPYYAAAKIVPECDVILAPYVSVFNESIRENMGIKTEGNILIVDEAHNLMNAVAEAQSSLVSVKAMSALSLQCKSYLAKFHGRLDEKQSSTIADIEKVASTLSEYRKLGAGEPGKVEAEELSIPSFIVALGLENAKFHELVAFLVSGDFCKKLRSFAERLWHGKLKRSEAAHDPAQNNYVSAVYEFRHFISTILSAGKHDRILVSSAPGDTTIELFSVSAGAAYDGHCNNAQMNSFKRLPRERGAWC
ncbi:DNA repair helicase family protein [Babesia caballi]|uniref:DNA repair helicase family protein n=1 Tax=Babesia caballi TaxID=5871 RepID=A0AAV4M149_BABCB|nr:DNA repair helicase family protein [Babesia caballi]